MKETHMNVNLTKKEALEILQAALTEWKKYPASTQELLDTEAWYAEHFHIFISQFPIKDEVDVISYATEKFKDALTLSFKKICKVLDQNQVPGHKIYDIMCDERFILRKDRKEYNRQIAGKYPKGLKREEWQSYNHWLLTNIYWDAIVWSQGPDFEKLLNDVAWQEDAFFSSNEIKPLWAMWLKGLEAEIPFLGAKDDNISIYPHACFVDYFGWQKIKMYRPTTSNK